MSLFGSNKNKEGELRLVIDIGSGSVGAALARDVVKDGNNKTEIVAISRQSIFFKEDLNFQIFLSSMMDALLYVLKDVHDRHLGAPHTIDVYLRAPWYSAQVREIKSSRESEFTVTHKLLTELLNRESSLFESGVKTKYQELHNELEILEQNTIGVQLNGYPVTHPIGARAKALSLSFFISASPREVLAMIRQKVRHIFPHRTIAFHSYILPMYVLLRNFLEIENDFIFLDIGGEISELSIIKNGILIQSATFPIGIHSLVRALMDEEDSTYLAAFSKIRMSIEGALKDGEQRKVAKILKSMNDAWIEEFSLALSSIAKGGTVPSTIYLSTDDVLMPWASSVIENEAFHRYTSTDRNFRVIPLATKLFADHISLAPGFAKDTFLTIESLYKR